MRIDLSESFYLDEVREGDQPAFVEHLNEKYLTDFMVLIPFPYTQQDADEWVALRETATRQGGLPTEFAIRNGEGFLVGAVGLAGAGTPHEHRADLGYWVARTYRGRGLGEAAVRAICDYGFSSLGLRRIAAWVFVENETSQRVVARAGFVREGCVAGQHLKQGKLVRSYLYGLLAPQDRTEVTGGT